MGNARNIAFWVVLFVLILALFNLFSGDNTTMSSRNLSYSDFIEAVESGSVSEATIDGEEMRVRTNDDTTYTTIIPPGVDPTEVLIENNVEVTAKAQQQNGRGSCGGRQPAPSPGTSPTEGVG